MSSDFTPPPDNPVSRSVRVFIKHPRQGWKAIDLMDSLEIYQDETLKLPQFASFRMTVAYVTVQVKAGAVCELEAIRAAEWRFDANGKLDQQAVMQGILAKLNADPAEVTDSPALVLPPGDLEQLRNKLGLG